MTSNAVLTPLKEATPPLDERSRYLRSLVVDALEGGERGHVGSSLSLIEIMRCLYDGFLEFRSDVPGWSERDRFILSKGHGCLALYAILADKNFFSTELLTTFCRQSSILGGHPERGKVPGIEVSSGALGHGLAIGVGMALGLRAKAKSQRVVVAMGDGEINEGSVWESALVAGKHSLSNLTVIVDYNKMQSYGPTAEVQPLEPLPEKWGAFGFETKEVDGHDVDALNDVFSRLPFNNDKPSAIICHTVKGKGIPIAENAASWHHKSRFTPADIEMLRRALGNG